MTILRRHRAGEAGDRHGFRAGQAASRRLLHHHPDHVPGPGAGARSAGDPAPRALADRPRHRRALRHLPGRRCRRRLLDHDLRRAGARRRDRGRGRGRRACRSRWGRRPRRTMELRRLAKAAASLGCEYIQVSCPFYFLHTEEDFYEYVCEAADAADIGIILYNTFWTSRRRLVRPGRAAGRAGAGAGRAEMGLPAHRRHGVRGRRRAPSPAG